MVRSKGRVSLPMGARNALISQILTVVDRLVAALAESVFLAERPLICKEYRPDASNYMVVPTLSVSRTSVARCSAS